MYLAKPLFTNNQFKGVRYCGRRFTNSASCRARRFHSSRILHSSLLPHPSSKIVHQFYRAAILPFQPPVWIGIALTILAILSVYYLFHYYHSSSKIDKGDKKVNTIHVFGLLLDQAGQNLNRKLPILLVGAVWCLSTLVLVSSYTSLLTSYITAPNPHSIIKSVEELRDRTDIQIVTDKYRSSEALLLAAESGLLKDLADKLRAYPNSRCDSVARCVDLVKSGSHAYVSTRDAFLLKAIADDLQATGQCNLEMGKKEIFMIQSTWALGKQSSYTSLINKGFMRMRDMGLIAHWMIEFRPRTGKCTQINKNKEESHLSKLSLEHLLGAFIALVTGYVVSLAVFIGERLFLGFNSNK